MDFSALHRLSVGSLQSIQCIHTWITLPQKSHSLEVESLVNFWKIFKIWNKDINLVWFSSCLRIDFSQSNIGFNSSDWVTGWKMPQFSAISPLGPLFFILIFPITIWAPSRIFYLLKEAFLAKNKGKIGNMCQNIPWIGAFWLLFFLIR